MFEVKIYKGKTLVEGAALALKHRLYVSGWCLSRELVDLKRGHNKKSRLGIGSLDGIPMCIIYEDADGNQLQAFCRKALRGNGYASAIIGKLKPKKKKANTDIRGTEKFWKVNGIKLSWQ